MKEATGEFSMTVITILAIVLIAGIVTWLAPKVTKYIEDTWTQIEGTDNSVNGALNTLD